MRTLREPAAVVTMPSKKERELTFSDRARG
jgi:hypothetical protein